MRWMGWVSVNKMTHGCVSVNEVDGVGQCK